MKKIFIVLLLFVLAGCTDDKIIENYDQSSVSDYFPVQKNISMSYESPTLPALNQRMFITYTDGDRFQRVIMFNEIAQTEVFEINDGAIKLINSEQQSLVPENMTKLDPVLDILVLAEPLTLGAKWDNGNGGTSEITGINVAVKVPYGEYEAMEVTTIDTMGRANKMYYAKGVGLIKSVYFDAATDREYAAELADISENVGINMGIGLYSVNEEGIDFDVSVVYFPFTTDGDLVALLSDAIQIKDGQDGILNGSVKSISVDRQTDTMNVDLSKGFTGKTEKEALINCLAFTIGKFYDIHSVTFTENGSKTGDSDSYSVY